MADITCSFGIRSKIDGAQDAIEVEPEGLTALLRKPEGFTGSPIFADDRKLDPRTDPYCRIRPDPGDKEGLIYTLHVKDLGKCGVLTKNVSFSGICNFPTSVNKKSAKLSFPEIWKSEFKFNSGLHQPPYLVSQVVRGRDDVGPGGDHHVQAARAGRHV